MKKLVDDTDIKILYALNKNCRIKVNQIAEIVHLSAPAVAARIANMEDSGVIRKYTIELDLEKVGLHRPIFIQVSLHDDNHKKYLSLINEYRLSIRHHYRTTGDMNYLIEGAFHDNEELNGFIIKLAKIANYRIYDVLSEEI